MEMRYRILDSLRGAALVSMAAYHAVWDAAFFRGAEIKWFGGPAGRAWQLSICCSFILLSGFCCCMGRRPLRRGLTVFACGALVTAATWFFPDVRIVCGVLTLLGSCMLLSAPLKGAVQKCPPWPSAAVCAALFLAFYNAPRGFLGFGTFRLELPAFLYNNAMIFVGFPSAEFTSADYFPLLPWAFLFFAGAFLFRAALALGFNEKTAERLCVPPLEFLGRHSLAVYLLHQPVLLALFALF